MECISMVLWNTAVTPLLTHWSYNSLALSDRYVVQEKPSSYITSMHGITPGPVHVVSVATNISDSLSLLLIPLLTYSTGWPILICDTVYSHWYIHSHLQHYGDVIMRAIASQITSLTTVYKTVYSGADQRKHPRHWPLCREFTGDRWIPRTNGQ